MIVRRCERCGCETTRRPYRYSDGAQHVFCHECSSLMAKEREHRERKIRNKSNQIKRHLINERGRSCAKCGGYFDSLHGHHVIPLHMGGENSQKNIMLLCESCHRSEHPHGTRSIAQ